MLIASQECKGAVFAVISARDQPPMASALYICCGIKRSKNSRKIVFAATGYEIPLDMVV
jgi:hypothetical protein